MGWGSAEGAGCGEVDDDGMRGRRSSSCPVCCSEPIHTVDVLGVIEIFELDRKALAWTSANNSSDRSLHGGDLGSSEQRFVHHRRLHAL